MRSQRAARRHLVNLDEPIRSAPDLVVDVLSPATESTDRGRKLQTFARFDVPEYWIVDPRAPSADVLRLETSGYTLESKVGSGGQVRSATIPDLMFEMDDLLPR